MILVLCAEDRTPWPPGVLARALELLPPPLREDVLACPRWAERQGRVLGRLLLRQGLERLGLRAFSGLEGWRRGPFGKPGLEGLPGDFSISHARGLAVCALNPGGRVGVDVEARALTDLDALRPVFHPREWEDILASAEPGRTAARLWTAKEAALKADGRGLALEPSDVDARGPAVVVDGAAWNIARPEVGPDWTCALASLNPPGEMEIVRMPLQIIPNLAREE